MRNAQKGNTYRVTSIIVGALFLTVMATWIIGYILIGGVINTPDNLTNIYPNQIKIFVGVIFEVIEIAAVVGILAMMFPIMKKYNENMALWYFGIRLLECVMLIIALVCPLILITLSKEYLNIADSDPSYFQTLSTLLIELRDKWVHTVLPFFYGFTAIIFYYFLYRTKLIPRVISVLGMIAAVLVLVGIPLDFIEFKPGAAIGALMGLSEIFLGVWLIVKGFNSSIIDSESGKLR